jgi:hypothetical protein
MKKILGTFCSVVMLSSFSAVVFAASPVITCAAKLTKQVILSEEDPTPAPAPAPAPAPEPEPK